MAKGPGDFDFFLDFGSNAKQWATGLATDLKPATRALTELNKLWRQLDTQSQAVERRLNASLNKVAERTAGGGVVDPAALAVGARGGDPEAGALNRDFQQLAQFTDSLVVKMAVLDEAMARLTGTTSKATAAEETKRRRQDALAARQVHDYGSPYGRPGKLLTSAELGDPKVLARAITNLEYSVKKQARDAAGASGRDQPPPGVRGVTEAQIDTAQLDRMVAGITAQVEATKSVESAIDRLAGRLNAPRVDEEPEAAPAKTPVGAAAGVLPPELVAQLEDMSPEESRQALDQLAKSTKQAETATRAETTATKALTQAEKDAAIGIKEGMTQAEKGQLRSAAAAAEREQIPGVTKAERQRRQDVQASLDVAADEETFRDAVKRRELKRKDLEQVAATYSTQGYPVPTGRGTTIPGIVEAIVGARKQYELSGGKTTEDLRTSGRTIVEDIVPEHLRQQLGDVFTTAVQQASARAGAVATQSLSAQTGGDIYRGAEQPVYRGDRDTLKGQLGRGGAFGGARNLEVEQAESTMAEYFSSLDKAAAAHLRTRAGSQIDPFAEGFQSGIEGRGAEPTAAKDAVAALRRQSIEMDKDAKRVNTLSEALQDNERYIDRATQRLHEYNAAQKRGGEITPELYEKVQADAERLPQAYENRARLSAQLAAEPHAELYTSPQFLESMYARRASETDYRQRQATTADEAKRQILGNRAVTEGVGGYLARGVLQPGTKESFAQRVPGLTYNEKTGFFGLTDGLTATRQQLIDLNRSIKGYGAALSQRGRVFEQPHEDVLGYEAQLGYAAPKPSDRSRAIAGAERSIDNKTQAMLTSFEEVFGYAAVSFEEMVGRTPTRASARQAEVERGERTEAVLGPGRVLPTPKTPAEIAAGRVQRDELLVAAEAKATRAVTAAKGRLTRATNQLADAETKEAQEAAQTKQGGARTALARAEAEQARLRGALLEDPDLRDARIEAERKRAAAASKVTRLERPGQYEGGVDEENTKKIQAARRVLARREQELEAAEAAEIAAATADAAATRRVARAAEAEKLAREAVTAAKKKEAAVAGGGAGAGAGGTGEGVAAAGSGGRFDNDILKKILTTLQAIHTTIKAGIRTGVRGGTAAEGGAAATRAARTRTGPSSSAGLETYAAELAKVDPELAQLVATEKTAATAVKLVEEGHLSAARAMELYRNELKVTGAAQKEFGQALADAQSRATGASAGQRAVAESRRRDAAAERDQVALSKRAATESERKARTQREEAAQTLRTKAAMDQLSASTRVEVDALRRLHAAGAPAEKVVEAQAKVYQGVARDLKAKGLQVEDISGPAQGVLSAAGPKVTQEDVAGIARTGRSLFGAIDKGAAEGAPGEGLMDPSSAFTKSLFGNTGFWGRVLNSTGTFLIRNFSAGLVFGLTNALQEVIAQALAAEQTFIRVSEALEETGQSSAGLRSDLMDISTDMGVGLNDVYTAAAGLTGVFNDAGQLAQGTRVVNMLQKISGGALDVNEAIRVSMSIQGAWGSELGNSADSMEHMADVFTVIQDNMGVNIEETAEATSRFAGLAAQLNITMEQAAVFGGQLAKLTGQEGAAAGEQFQRIIAVMQTGRGRAVLEEAFAGTNLPQQLAGGQYGEVLKSMAAGWDDLTQEQQRNVSVTLGGQRQAAAIAAMFSDGTKVLNTLTKAEQANGEATERVTKLMQTLQGQLAKLGANFQAFADALIQTGLIDVIGYAVAGFNLLFGVVNDVLSTFNDLTDSGVPEFLKKVTFGILGLVAVWKLLTGSIRGANAAMTAMKASSAGQALAGARVAAPVRAPGPGLPQMLRPTVIGQQMFGRAGTDLGAAGLRMGTAADEATSKRAQVGYRALSGTLNVAGATADRASAGFSRLAAAGLGMDLAMIGGTIAVVAMMQSHARLKDAEDIAREAGDALTVGLKGVSESSQEAALYIGKATAARQEDTEFWKNASNWEAGKRALTETIEFGIQDAIGGIAEGDWSRAGKGLGSIIPVTAVASGITGKGDLNYFDEILGFLPEEQTQKQEELKSSILARVERAGSGLGATVEDVQDAQSDAYRRIGYLRDEILESDLSPAQQQAAISALEYTKQAMVDAANDEISAIEGLANLGRITSEQIDRINEQVQMLGSLRLAPGGQLGGVDLTEGLAAMLEETGVAPIGAGDLGGTITQLIDENAFKVDLLNVRAKKRTGGQVNRALDAAAKKFGIAMPKIGGPEDLRNLDNALKIQEEMGFIADVDPIMDFLNKRLARRLPKADPNPIYQQLNKLAKGGLDDAERAIAVRDTMRLILEKAQANWLAIKSDPNVDEEKRQTAYTQFLSASQNLQQAEDAAIGAISQNSAALADAASAHGKFGEAAAAAEAGAAQIMASIPDQGVAQVGRTGLGQIAPALEIFGGNIKVPRGQVISEGDRAVREAQASALLSRATQERIAGATSGLVIAQGANADALGDAGINRQIAEATLAQLLDAYNAQGATGATIQEINDARTRVYEAREAEANALTENKVAAVAAQGALLWGGLAQAQNSEQQALIRLNDAASIYGTGSTEWLQALAAYRSTQQQVAQAIQDQIAARYDLSIAVADAAGYTVRSAVLANRKALQALRVALDRSGGQETAEVLQARATAVQAEAGVRDARYQSQLDTVDFQLEMERITASQAIKVLQHMLKADDLTKQQRRELLLKIKGLRDEMDSGESIWNLGDIKLPTPYEVRRSLGIDKLRRDSRTARETIRDSMGDFGGRDRDGGGVRSRQYGTQGDEVTRAMNNLATAMSGASDVRDVTIEVNGADVAKVRAVLQDLLGGNIRRSGPGRRKTTVR